MESVNRFALIVTPKRRYMEWANQDTDGPQLTVDELPSLTEVYLLDASDSEADREQLIDIYAEEIWEQQLDGWSTDESTWPKNRTPHTLRDWFNLTFVDMVFDADPDVEWHELPAVEELAETAITTCQWCLDVRSPDAEVVTLPIKLPSDDPIRSIAGPIVPILIAGSTRLALKAQPGSDMAHEGKDLMLAFCSDRCAEAMRQAIARERAALLS